MAIASFNKPKTDNWELITTSSPSGLTTITLSSIDTFYQKLYLTWNLTSSLSNSQINLTINNDTGNNYLSTAIAPTSASTGAAFAADAAKVDKHILHIAGVSSTAWIGYLEISDASTNYAKLLHSEAVASGGTYTVVTQANGIYDASAALSRLDIVTSGSALSGTVKLYGVRN